jgi:hypothetical protein
MKYQLPTLPKPPRANKRDVLLVASGDLRLSANQKCWAAQSEMEESLRQALEANGHRLLSDHPFKDDVWHVFIYSHKDWMSVFS